MSQPLPPSPTPPSVPPTGRMAPPEPRPGCGSRLLSGLGWLFTVVFSAALGVAALAVISYFVFGVTPATPGQIRQSSTDIAALQRESLALRAELGLLRTAEAERAGTLDAAATQLSLLETQVAGYSAQTSLLADQAATAAALGRELTQAIDQAATIQAEGRENQVLVQVVATVQADNTSRLNDLQQRADRVSRFLDRLSDLAGDVNNGGPLAPPVPSPTPTVTPEPEPTPSPTP
ncbi:MAG: hypothetical protein AB4911_13370 [Oscillochloridaceae bacterium umkhey_bin13]